jgi:DNA-binding MarR family transcriptional regulator
VNVASAKSTPNEAKTYSCDDLVELWQATRRAANAAERTFDAQLRETLGTTLTQYSLLNVLGSHDSPITIDALASQLGLTKSSVSRQVDAAISEGLVSVAPQAGSRREKPVEATDTGRALVARGDDMLDTLATALLTSVPRGEFDATLRTLGALGR